jgi:hypothetical protein
MPQVPVDVNVAVASVMAPAQDHRDEQEKHRSARHIEKEHRVHMNSSLSLLHFPSDEKDTGTRLDARRI